jgi:hypothetical protein
MTVDPALLAEIRRALNDTLPEYMKDLAANVPTDLVRQIAEDARRGDIHGRAGMIPQPKATSQQTETPADRSGWRDAPAIKPPEGVALVDKLVDMQDRLDAAARARQLGLSPEEWARLSEKDIANHKAQQAKKAEVKK